MEKIELPEINEEAKNSVEGTKPELETVREGLAQFREEIVSAMGKMLHSLYLMFACKWTLEKH